MVHLFEERCFLSIGSDEAKVDVTLSIVRVKRTTGRVGVLNEGWNRKNREQGREASIDAPSFH